MSSAPQFDEFIHSLCAEKCADITFSLSNRHSRFQPDRNWIVLSDQSRDLYGVDCSKVERAQNYFALLATAADYCEKFGLKVVRDWCDVMPLKEERVSLFSCGRETGVIAIATTAARWRTSANHLKLDYPIKATLSARYSVSPDRNVLIRSVSIKGPDKMGFPVQVESTQTEVKCMICEPNDHAPESLSFEVSIAELTLSVDQFARLVPGDIISLEKKDAIPCFLKFSGSEWAEGEVQWCDGGVQIKIVETRGAATPRANQLAEHEGTVR